MGCKDSRTRRTNHGGVVGRGVRRDLKNPCRFTLFATSEVGSVDASQGGLQITNEGRYSLAIEDELRKRIRAVNLVEKRAKNNYGKNRLIQKRSINHLSNTT